MRRAISTAPGEPPISPLLASVSTAIGFQVRLLIILVHSSARMSRFTGALRPASPG
jgi:hypothetical protein